MRAVYSGVSDYGTGNMASALVGELPSKWVSGGNSLVNAFGKQVLVTAITNEFSVQMDGLPNEVCTRMVTQDLGTGMVSVTAGGVTANSAPIAPAQAPAACGATNNNSVVWTFF